MDYCIVLILIAYVLYLISSAKCFKVPPGRSDSMKRPGYKPNPKKPKPPLPQGPPPKEGTSNWPVLSVEFETFGDVKKKESVKVGMFTEVVKKCDVCNKRNCLQISEREKLFYDLDDKDSINSLSLYEKVQLVDNLVCSEHVGFHCECGNWYKPQFEITIQ